MSTRVWWEAMGDPTKWPEPGTASSATVRLDFASAVAPRARYVAVVRDFVIYDTPHDWPRPPE
jgi:hypothetical protein